MLLSTAYSVCAGTKFQVNILMMAELLHQAVYSVIYRVFYIPGGAGYLPSTVHTWKGSVTPKNALLV